MNSENNKIISFMFSCVKKQWKLQLPGMLCSAASSVLGIVGTSIFALLVDKVLMGGNRKLLWPVQLAFIGSVFAGFLLNMMAAYLFSIAGNAERLSLRQRFFAHILRLPNHFFEVNKPGEIFSRLMDDVNRVGYSIFEGVTNFIISVFTLILLYSWMFYVDYRLTLMALMLIPLFLIVDKRVYYRVEKYNRRYQKEMGETNGELQQSLAGILAIKTLNLQDWAHMSFFDKCKALARTGFLLDMSFAYMRLGSWTLVVLPFQGLMFLLGGYLYLTRGYPTVGTILAFQNYTNMMIAPIFSIMGFAGTVATIKASLTRIQEYMDIDEEQLGQQRPEDLGYRPIYFEGVKFQYPGATKQVLDGVSFCIQPGQMVGLVGESGAGKTTILNILFGALSPSQGEVLFGTTPLQQLDIYFLRQRVSYVSQHNFLFNATLRENLLLANPQASESQLLEVLRRAQLSSFVDSLEKGLDTQVGEHGAKLSGGEKQRLAIAQALLRDTPILLLDEPTSSLDTATEKAFIEILKQYRHKKTIVIVSHRPTILEDCDQVLVLNNGKIVAQGHFDQVKSVYEAVLATEEMAAEGGF